LDKLQNQIDFELKQLRHQGLLEAMSRSTAKHPAIISMELRKVLKEYLGFRHIFRNLYAFELKWKKMAPLVVDSEKTLNQFESELKQFMSSSPNL